MDKGYANSRLLISATELITQVSEHCIVDTRPVHQYMAGHIPNAISLDLFSISLTDTREQPFQAFMSMIGILFARRGVDLNRSIIFYEDVSGMCAARGFWFCEYLGHRKTQVLDGGIQSWLQAGVVIDINPVVPPHLSGLPISPQSDTHTNVEEILGQLDEPDFVVLDTRSADEHYARVARADRAGAIPGSIHIEWTENLNPDGTFKPAHQLQKMYNQVGVTSDKRITCYCQGGYRSAHSYLALRLLGYPRVSNYIGSWKEWGDRHDLPIEIRTD